MVEFTTLRMIYSIAKTLDDLFGYPIYIDPKQQGMKTPCFFIQLIGSGQRLKEEIKQMGTYTLHFDITYLTEYNKNNKYSDYYFVLDRLEANLDNVKYINDEGDTLASFGIHERDYTTDLQALHYKFKTMFRARLVDTENNLDGNKLKQLIYNLSIKNGRKINGRFN